MKDKIKWFIILHIIIFIYSINSISAKTAAQYDFLSPKWMIFYGIVICILGFYAIAWQQVLKHLPLITTYANKAVTTMWGLVWGFLIFHEKITPLKVLASAIVIFGVYLVGSGDESLQESQDVKEADKND
ncbi:MAG: DMT family transporter [Pseudobutyrivibrio sp.]|nr:DMT family transporter [Pseudobutyrivibrio sp.]